MVLIEELLSLAEVVLVADDRDEELPNMLAEYSRKFSIWFDNAKPDFDKGDISDIGPVELIQNLLATHQKVIAKGESSKRCASTDLKNLQVKGKGIKVYTDNLPKRISLTSTKKG